MVYEDREDEFMSADDQQIYEHDRYDENIADTFREQIPGDEAIKPAPDEALEDETPAKNVESGFRESINPDSNPHLDDQLQDEDLSAQAKKDYSSKD